MMKRLYIILLCTLAVCMAASAQSSDKLYKEAKALYDAKNYAAAVPKLKIAAEKGHKKAQYRLGRCYDKGRGMAENNSLAFQWYLKSAKQDYAKAQYRVAKCYKDGEGVLKDRKKAFEYFTKSANQDYAEAQYSLGKCYMKGKGTQADQKKAVYWFKKAVSNADGGSEILAELRADASKGDEDAKAILKMIRK